MELIKISLNSSRRLDVADGRWPLADGLASVSASDSRPEFFLSTCSASGLLENRLGSKKRGYERERERERECVCVCVYETESILLGERVRVQAEDGGREREHRVIRRFFVSNINFK